MATENQAVTHLRRAAGSRSDSQRDYRIWCVELATSLTQRAALDPGDRDRLKGVLQAFEAYSHADELLVVPLDRWTLFAAAEQELAELWSRYERASGTAAEAG